MELKFIDHDAKGKKVHKYLLNGRPLTSVTTVLKVIAKPGLMPWALDLAAKHAVDNPGATYAEIKAAPDRERDEAANRGTEVHHLAEAIIHGKPVEVPEALIPYIDPYIRFLDEFQVTPILTEHTVLLADFNVGGRFDLIATSPHLNGGAPFIADLKTGKNAYAEVKAQLAAYGLADGYVTDKDPATLLELPYVTASYVIHVRPDGAKVIPCAESREELDGHFDFFASAYHLYELGLAKNKLRDPIPYPSTITTAA